MVLMLVEGKCVGESALMPWSQSNQKSTCDIGRTPSTAKWKKIATSFLISVYPEGGNVVVGWVVIGWGGGGVLRWGSRNGDGCPGAGVGGGSEMGEPAILVGPPAQHK